MTRTAAKRWQWLHVHHFAFVTMDSGTLTGQIERKKDAEEKWLKCSDHIDTVSVSMEASL